MSYDISLKCCGHDVFDRNHTSNTAQMWKHAGAELSDYEGKDARELIAPVSEALQHMKQNPDVYLPMNPKNGWGSYESTIEFLEDIRSACEKYPDLIVRVSS